MSSQEEREALRLNFSQLTKNLNPMEIIDDMLTPKLLTSNEHSEVERKTRESRRDGASALLKALQRRQPGSLRVFIDLLSKVQGSEFLAKGLAADLDRGEWRPRQWSRPCACACSVLSEWVLDCKPCPLRSIQAQC